MRVLVVGSGGREHALAWKLSRAEETVEIHAAPGNPGIAELGACHPVRPDDGEGLLALARELGADLVSFQRLRNWGTFSVAEFADLDVASPAHPRHEALRAMLTQPCFAGADIDLGNLRPSARGWT